MTHKAAPGTPVRRYRGTTDLDVVPEEHRAFADEALTITGVPGIALMSRDGAPRLKRIALYGWCFDRRELIAYAQRAKRRANRKPEMEAPPRGSVSTAQSTSNEQGS